MARFSVEPCPAVQNLYFVGRNYVKHAEELGNEIPETPLIFTKPVACVVMSGARIPYPAHSQSLHFEGEMIFVLPKDGRFCGEAPSVLAGCGIDFTARDVQSALKKKGWPWFTAKCFRGAAVLSDRLVRIPLELLPHLSVETIVNGQKRQHGLYTQKLFPLPVLSEYLSGLVPIGEQDVLFTGTPAGVGELVVGDRIEVRLLFDGEEQVRTVCEVT